MRALAQHGLAMGADAALRGARAMAVAELAAEPKLREVMRDLFYQHAVLSTSARAARACLGMVTIIERGFWCKAGPCSTSTPCAPVHVMLQPVLHKSQAVDRMLCK